MRYPANTPMRLIPHDGTSALGDFQRHPGCRLLIVCALCGWSKGYNPERVIARLHQLKAGGHATRLPDVAKRVGWDCPACHHVKWRAQFAWPASLPDSEIKRLTNRYRN